MIHSAHSSASLRTKPKPQAKTKPKAKAKAKTKAAAKAKTNVKRPKVDDESVDVGQHGTKKPKRSMKEQFW